jgi:pimeloyl-ACP methyl ester carboxylesterase
MGRLDEVTAPTLVIVGTEDADVVIDGCRATARGIDGAELIEFDDTAHLPNLEVTTAFNAALEGFLG